MSERPALVIGFEPYAGRGSNPAADIANALDSCVIANVPVVGRLLPVALEEIAVNAASLLDELQPRIVINASLWREKQRCKSSVSHSIWRISRSPTIVGWWRTTSCYRQEPVPEHDNESIPWYAASIVF